MLVSLSSRSRVTLLGIALLAVCPWMGLSALADESPITRRDGFLLVWETVRRPAQESKEKPYVDVSKGSKGFLEITYAKSRGILADAAAFRPDEGLMLSDALIMLLRTRNVDEPDAISPLSLPAWLKKYPLGDFVDPTKGENGTLMNRAISESELRALQLSFDEQLKKETHEVSLYSEKFHGKGTAFGESFDMYAMTAAHRTFPANTLVRVTNVANGKSVVVRINDRGPYVAGRDMDLSLGAFTSIEARSKGKFRATFERLGDASLVQENNDHDQTTDTDQVLAESSAKTCVTTAQQARIGAVRFLSGVPQSLPLGKNLLLQANQPFAVRNLTLPDGSKEIVDRWIKPGDKYEFAPSVAGSYSVSLGAKNGRGRVMKMEVVACGDL